MRICREFENWRALRALSGKFLRQKSCYPESFCFLWLWLARSFISLTNVITLVHKNIRKLQKHMMTQTVEKAHTNVTNASLAYTHKWGHTWGRSLTNAVSATTLALELLICTHTCFCSANCTLEMLLLRIEMVKCDSNVIYWQTEAPKTHHRKDSIDKIRVKIFTPYTPPGVKIFICSTVVVICMKF